MKIDLDQILALAGDLVEEGARDRFRRFLLDSAKDSDSIKELATSALKVSDTQHHLALQDIVLSLGAPLGFDPGLSFGGHWKSLAGVIFLLELVAGDEPLDIAALVGRVEAAEKEVLQDEDGGAADEKDELSVLVLIVAQDSELLRVEEAIIEGDSEGQVRAISISALLVLSKIAKDYRLTHDDVLLLLLTSGPSVDPIVDLIARIISQCEAETPTLEEIAQILGPTSRGGESTSEGALSDLIDQSRYYAFGNRGYGRRDTRI
jgi:hypothetical protein